MDIPSNTFDKIVITWVIHHIADDIRPDLLQSIVNTLKPNGKIYVIGFLALPHGILEVKLIDLFNEIGLSGKLEYRKKNTGLFEFKRN